MMRLKANAQEMDSRASTSEPVSFIVCTKDRCSSLARCLASLVAQLGREDEIIVVDNSLTGNAQKVAGAAGAKWIHESRPGSSWARNRGFQEARHEIISYFDDDCEADWMWAQELHLPFRDPTVAIVTGSVLANRPDLAIPHLIDSKYPFHRGWSPIRYEGSTGTRWSPFDVWRVGVGGTMAWRRSWLTQIGGFDPALGAGTPAGSCEDIDALRRAIALGATICYQPTAVAWHAHPQYPEGLRHLLIRYAVALGAHAAKQIFEEKQWKGLAFLFHDWCWQVASGLRGLFSRTDSDEVEMPAQSLLVQPLASIVGMYRFVRYRHTLRKGQTPRIRTEVEARPAAPPPLSGVVAVEAELTEGILDQMMDSSTRLLIRLRGRPVFCVQVRAGNQVKETLERELPEPLQHYLGSQV